MKKIRVYFAYKHIDEPWGGANNFIRALFGHFNDSPEFSVESSMDAPADILFLNQLGKGRGGGSGWYKISEIKKWKAKNPQGRIIIRAINLRAHSNPNDPLRKMFNNFLRDRATLSALKLADFTIFQSEYQKGFFQKSGYKRQENTVIHNGAPPSFQFSGAKTSYRQGDTLRCVSTSMATGQNKRHDIIAALSTLPSIEITHIGSWPKHIDKKNVELLGVQSHEQIIKHMRDSHYFLHPAQNDPCPNSVIEALRFGLPVLYHPGTGSSPEIVRGFGVALNERDLASSIEDARKSHAALSAALEDCVDQFSVERAARDYAAVFKSVMGYV